ncbi:MAG: hypothetical protein ACKD6M_00295 [Candidatus Bathyarchaeota archaeon]
MGKNKGYSTCLGLFPLMVVSGMIYSILAIYINEAGHQLFRLVHFFTVGVF